ncbi:transcription initiation factor IIA large subunit-like isoform X2 [Salvia miltiorrhiza]|uniref:transcription initiation factor IIA large subunit-like isoform X2 n=1 Tax=Salvia miltiorrhiza TaxID=226208 RepID=UPI0025ABF54B|nr:transcription initiation factor IIA large subunit-like isoform X2 [Salvia miltiorrhiza]
MASTGTSNIYIHVIEDVINKVRDEFINDGGPGDAVLAELQGLWELKMMQAGAILGPIDRSAKQKAAGGPITPNPVHDLNVPYEGTEEYETPTADMLFPPTPLQTPMQTPLPGMAQTPLPGTAQTPLPGTAQTPLPGNDTSPYYNIPTGGTPITPNEYSSNNVNGSEGQIRAGAGAGRPSQYMQPPSSWLNQRPPLDVNVAYVEGREEGDKGAPNHPSTQDFFLMPSGKRKRDDIPPQYHSGGYIPQQDGAGDIFPEVLKVGLGSTAQMPVQEGSPSCRIPQLDGPIPDPYDDALSTPNMYNYQGVMNEDYNIVNTPMPNEMQAATPAPVPNEPVDDDDDEPLNEDDDDELDDLEQGEDLNTTHLVLAQFDKVTRTKSRWKCTLKDGIMHVNNKDILFNKATGEFDF